MQKQVEIRVGRPEMTLPEITQAIKARKQGVWDDSALVKFGPLFGEESDIRELQRMADQVRMTDALLLATSKLDATERKLELAEAKLREFQIEWENGRYTFHP